MEPSNQPISWGLIFVVLVIVSVIQLVYLSILHAVRGGAYRNESKSSRALLFSTSLGDYRVDKVYRQWSYKLKNERSWSTVPFDDIVSIYRFREVDRASLFEFIFSDFSIWDFSGNYRDLMHRHHIILKTKSGEQIKLLTLRQYEQREWMLGQILHDIQVYILVKLGWYKDIDDVGNEWLYFYVDKVAPYGLKLEVQ